MTRILHNRVAHSINKIGYDISTETLEIIFTRGAPRYYQPVPYSLYNRFAYAPFPERFFRQVIDGRVPELPPA